MSVNKVLASDRCYMLSLQPIPRLAHMANLILKYCDNHRVRIDYIAGRAPVHTDLRIDRTVEVIGISSEFKVGLRMGMPVES